MQSQPLTTTAAPPPGNGDEYGDFFLIREDFSQGINLDLGIASCPDGEGLKWNKKIKQEKKGSIFTAAQFYDFYSQVCVYKCITSGLPVPLHLFLSIWISVFNSFGPAVYKIYPSFLGSTRPNPDHHRTKMDPEPDRCRRTDGRKWRCTKNAVPSQKYCERHMHRGRQGSRKHVEPNATFSKPDTKISVDNMMLISSTINSERVNRVDISESQPDFDNARKISGRNHVTVKNDYPGFGSSPKSVLHCGAGKIGLGGNNVIKNVPQRCRRTDGRKWQCSREALPNQKYCERHMHRGAKRVMFYPRPVSNFPAPSARKACSSNAVSGNLDNSINLNTVPTSPQNIGDDDCTSGSSDATTITDEHISFRVARSLTNC